MVVWGLQMRGVACSNFLCNVLCMQSDVLHVLGSTFVFWGVQRMCCTILDVQLMRSVFWSLQLTCSVLESTTDV